METASIYTTNITDPLENALSKKKRNDLKQAFSIYEKSISQSLDIQVILWLLHNTLNNEMLLKYFYFINKINVSYIPYDILLLIYIFTPIDCAVCYLPTTSNRHFKECIKCLLNDILYSNIEQNKINTLIRNNTVNDILNYLTLNNKCKNCYNPIDKFYKPMDKCITCNITLCNYCYANCFYVTNITNGMYFYFIIWNK